MAGGVFDATQAIWNFGGERSLVFEEEDGRCDAIISQDAARNKAQSAGT
jgi:hypothetical protein